MDKQHAVISVNEETQEYKLHDLGTLNGVSDSLTLLSSYGCSVLLFLDRINILEILT